MKSLHCTLQQKFPGLTVEAIRDFEQHGSLMNTRKYHLVYGVHEYARQVYILLSGSMKIGNYSAQKNEVVKHIVHSPCIIGMASIRDQLEYGEFAMSLAENTQLLALESSVFKMLMHRHQCIMDFVMNLVNRQLKEMESRLFNILHMDAKTRIIEFIAHHVLENGVHNGVECHLNHGLTQQDIANFTGTSRQTVTSVMNDLKKENLIFFNRNVIMIHDIHRLQTA